jgi:hypothetical protein
MMEGKKIARDLFSELGFVKADWHGLFHKKHFGRRSIRSLTENVYLKKSVFLCVLGRCFLLKAPSTQ